MIEFAPSDFQRKAYGLVTWNPSEQWARFTWGEARWSRHGPDDWRIDVTINRRLYRGKTPKRPTPSELHAFSQGLQARGVEPENWLAAI